MLGAIDAGKKVMEVGSKLVETQKKLKQVIENFDVIVPLLENIQADIQEIKENQKRHGEMLEMLLANSQIEK
tara:strand:- start:348 stop:563 length:216 start_codon:yes stop_codon:yes gene_type:complete